jgi:TolB protein
MLRQARHLHAWLLAAAALMAVTPATAQAASREQSTQLISHAYDGGLPNAPSTNAVISNDKRYARVVAYQSNASNIVRGDTNGVTDVFAVKRAGHVGNTGSPWKVGKTVLISRTAGGEPANGPSYSPAVSGAFHEKPSCVAFLSQASNIVRGDTNGVADAFVKRVSGGKPRRVSLPGRRQAAAPTTHVAVSGNCKLIAFVTGGQLYVWKSGRVKHIRTKGSAADPSFSTGLRNDLVFGASGGVYLSRNGTGRPKLVAPGGRNPAYNDIKRRVVTYEVDRGGHSQIGYRDVGRREKIISARRDSTGNRDSRAPVIGNSGYYVTFESEASNLGVNALGRAGDDNGAPDVYLYTNVRDITLVQSVEHKAEPVPGGGRNPSMSFYANYIVFDSPAPLMARNGPHQIYMRYLGPV